MLERPPQRYIQSQKGIRLHLVFVVQTYSHVVAARDARGSCQVIGKPSSESDVSLTVLNEADW